MNPVAWSQNLTSEAAKAAGATLVSKDQLFEQAPYHRTVSSGATAPASRRNAQLLPPRGRLTVVDPLFGHYGIVVLRSLLTRWRYFQPVLQPHHMNGIAPRVRGDPWNQKTIQPTFIVG
jgi:hypothetical protein